MKKLLTLQFLLLIGISFSFSQQIDSTKTVRVLLKDDNEIIGHIIAKDSVNTTVRGLTGIVSVIPKSQITEIKVLKGMIIGNEYYKPDPADNRIMAFPTARPLKSGQVQFNAVELLFPHLIFGVTDYVNIGIGGLPIVTNGSGTFVYVLSSKITPVNFKEAAVSLGEAILGSTSTNGIVGVAYAVGTFGDELRSFTVGPFMAFSSDAVYKRPAILLGGQTRISKSSSLLTENVFLFGNETEDFFCFPSIGIRFSGENLAADFGTYAVVSKKGFFYPIPWIGLSYRF